MPHSTPNPHDHTLYLIDGHAQMFRAYHAIRGGMTSPVTGEPTNATFAFAGLLIKLFTQYQPHYVAMAIDSPGDTFRHAFYPAYKANRSEPPEDFAPQIPRMLEVARLFGIPILEVPGDEADDIIATLAVRLTAGEDATRVRMVAKDKDLEQVLSDRVTLFDAHTDVELDPAGLEEKRGIRPRQVIDYQTLLGDTTDNIPGVKGIGPKTASKLINQFGSVAELVANLDQLKGKQKENLQAAVAAGDLELTRRLVTLKRDTEIAFQMDDARVSPDAIAAAELDELFGQLGFNRHRADLKKLVHVPTAAASPKQRAVSTSSAGAGGLFDQGGPEAGEPSFPAGDPLEIIDGNYSAITTAAQLQELGKTLRKQTLLAVDTETVGLGSTADLCGICLAWKVGHGVYIPTRSPDPSRHLDQATVLDALRPILENPDLPKVGHNIKYDWHVLRQAGVSLNGIAHDTMVAAFLLRIPGARALTISPVRTRPHHGAHHPPHRR